MIKNYIGKQHVIEHIGRVDFNMTGLIYKVYSCGLTSSELSLMPTDSFLPKRTIVSTVNADAV